MFATVVGLGLSLGGAANAQHLATDGGWAIVPDASEVTVGGASKGGGITPLAVVPAGGGTWNYGSALTVVPPKTCWSNYKHPTNYHSSTVIMGSVNVTDYANAGVWTDASVGGGLAYGCTAYWNN